MSDAEDTKRCPNCKLDILFNNYTIHYVHCQRNFYLCSKCEQPVNYGKSVEHDETNHVTTYCINCHRAVEKCYLDDHLINDCPNRKVKCQICDIDVNAVDVKEHEDYCGSRTEKCIECGEFIMLKYKSLHFDSNHAFIKLTDEPGPSPSWQYGKRTLCNFMPDFPLNSQKPSCIKKKKSNESLRKSKTSGLSDTKNVCAKIYKKNLNFCDGEDEESCAADSFETNNTRKSSRKDKDEWPVLSTLRSLKISDEKLDNLVATKESSFNVSQNDMDEDTDLMYAIQVSQEINSEIWKKEVSADDETLKKNFKPSSEIDISTKKSVQKNMFEKESKNVKEQAKFDVLGNNSNFFYNKQEIVKLPCEFCGNLILSNDLILHQSRCSFYETNNYGMQSSALKMTYFDEDVEKKIACGVCNKFFRLSLLENHQFDCQKNSSRFSKNHNLSKNLKSVNIKSEPGLQNGLELSSPQLTRVGTRSEWLSELSKSNERKHEIRNNLSHSESGVATRGTKVSRKSRRAPSPPASIFLSNSYFEKCLKMSEQDRKDFDDRLAELNSWQIEQQKKLKVFQETQRKLLDLEHQNVLNGFNTHNYGQRHDRCIGSISGNVCKKEEIESNIDLQNFNSKDGIFPLKFPNIRLPEPKTALFSFQNCSSSVDKNSDFYGELVENSEERDMNKQRKFLRRGEGLARFRMTLDDFKGPPKIYREKKIKTYLNSKPESKISSRNIKSLRSNVRPNRSSAPKVPIKAAPLPVKIYMPENNPISCNTGRGIEGKQLSQNTNKLAQYPKSSVENFTLKPHCIATEWYNTMKSREKCDARSVKLDEKSNSVIESDIENKKDEKELKIFEILEKKVDDVSFSSNSSFLDKLMEQSLSSTPSKYCPKNREGGLSYIQGLKSLRSQFLDEEQVKKFEELDGVPFEKVPEETELEKDNFSKNSLVKIVSDAEKGKVRETFNGLEGLQPHENEVQILKVIKNEQEPQPHKVNKTLLQGYIKDLKKFKILLAENAPRMEEQPAEDVPPKELLKEDKEVDHSNQLEMALKLQRKGLQDNVKQLLNWECPPRKRQPKRLVKKIKFRAKLDKSKAVNKEQSDKVVFNSSLLHEKLNELEKEIEIFRKENKNLERLEKECSEERMKLSKERKELLKQVNEEKAQLEGKIAEEHKKLQKEKAVFEKYCKQIKNQPTRQEREETAKLKKEIEKLMETMATKEARWGASQARLRNQIKILEKENTHLKQEIEKYKNLSTKKVSFESEKNLNTKIIHVINSELGKLKPGVMKNTNDGRNQSLSARIDRNLGEKPIRRIKSAPNVKKQLESDLCTEAYGELDEKALGSVSTDSGIETNGSRDVPVQMLLHDSKITNEIAPEKPGSGNCKSPVYGSTGEDATANKLESPVESGVREAIFGDTLMNGTSKKIAEVKSRLERLSLLGCTEESSENSTGKMIRLPSDREDSESEEECDGWIEDERQDAKRGSETGCFFKKGMTTKTGSISNTYSHRNLIESKAVENGIWEKLFEDGSKEINYRNGNVRKIFPGSKIIRMTYYNGDIKETDVAEGSEKYYYAETKTWHTTYKDGLEVLEFPNGQTERRHADGSSEITFPNGCVRYCDSSGRDEWRFLDGTVIKTNHCGHKILLLPNGQKEIHTKEYKRREYPDGTVKILYSDGTQETRYSSGRVRLKDKDGNLVMDSGGVR